MLKFLPKIKLLKDSTYLYAQQMNLGLGRSQTNCMRCVHYDEWTESFTQTQCQEKYDCYTHECPWILMTTEHQFEINNKQYTSSPPIKYYRPVAKVQQVKVKGWPLYLQLVTCNDPDPQCNAYCYWHPIRFQKHQSVPVCAHTHGCSRSGSFFALLIPDESTLQEEFYYELNMQEP